MFLLGYHGTSKAAATGLIIDGPKVSHAYAALGAGLYVARDCGFLVSFFSRVAQQRDSFKKSDYGEKGSSVGKIAKSTDGSIILKIYSTVPLPQLRKCRWDIMDISQYGISPRDNLNDLNGMSNNLQLVIPPEYFKYIRAVNYIATGGNNERPVSWPINEWPNFNRRETTQIRRRNSI
jgi:hypothetical protein